MSDTDRGNVGIPIEKNSETPRCIFGVEAVTLKVIVGN